MGAGPVIGIVGHGYVVPKPFGDLPVAGTPGSYVSALAAVGARPVVLPPGGASDLLDLVDGLVLTGGGDVDPCWYGGPPGVGLDVDRERDRAELDLVRAASRRRIPLLGVCRGLQVLVVALGGSLTGDVPHLLPAVGHPVTSEPGSLVNALLGDSVLTTSLHHQAVATTGPVWRATAWAEDGVIEAVEWAGDDWPTLGVQWHPEIGSDATGPALFGWLCAATSARVPR